jgi:group I intron endonuclease
MDIYKITNNLNGKSYIGQTVQSMRRRKSEHLYRMANQPERNHKLYMALRKYGMESFTWEVLESCQTVEELNEREKYYINAFNTYNRGYNMTEGGDTVSEETKEKLRKIFTGRIITWGHKISETRKKNKTTCGVNHPNYGHYGKNASRHNSYVITEPNGTEHLVIGLRHWVRNWNREILQHGALVLCAQGKQTHTKGYKCRYAKDVQRSGESRTPKQVEMGSIPQG